MDSAKLSKICRICCNLRQDELISLINEENKVIIKKLRACADVTIEQDDLLPKYICTKCLQKLNLSYNFKIQCEYMDQKLRDSIASLLQKQADQPLGLSTQDSSSCFESEDGSSCGYSSEQIIMDDIETIIEEDCVAEGNLIEDCVEEEHLMGNEVYFESNNEFNQFGQENNRFEVVPFEAVKNDTETNVMDISQKIVQPEKFDSLVSLPSAKEPDECVDQEMFSVKSDNASSPKVKSPYKCDTCDAQFHIHSEYNKHTKTHGKNRFQCLICNKWFAKRYLLNAHQKTHTGAKNYACLQCPKRYTSQTNLDRHIRVFHRHERQYKCTTCHKTFSQLSTLKLHQSVHLAERNFACDICSNKFKTEIHLKLHKKRHLPTEHRPIRRKNSPQKKITSKTPQKLCACRECDKRFNSLALLRSHMQTHSLEKKYECEFCKKRFSFQQSLRNHIFVHTGEKKFQCNICNISFRQIGHLQGHKLIHSGIKPHACVKCGKAFALRGNLTVHMRTHSGLTPFECTLCPKKFNDSNGLKKHYLIHKRKKEENVVIEPIHNVPIEAPSVNEIIDAAPPLFENEPILNVAETLQFIPPPELNSDNPQFIF